MHFHVISQFSCQNCYLRQANTLPKHQQFIRSNSNNSFLVTMNNLKSIENKTLSYIKILRQAVHKAIQRKLSSSARAPKSQLKHSHVNNPCKDRPDVIAAEPCPWTFPCFPTKISAPDSQDLQPFIFSTSHCSWYFLLFGQKYSPARFTALRFSWPACILRRSLFSSLFESFFPIFVHKGMVAIHHNL